MAIVLVTGGAGFIGSHLVERLLHARAVVRVLDNLSTGCVRNLQPKVEPDTVASGRRLELIVGDIRDETLVRKVMRQVECVFHLAALPAPALLPAHVGEMHAVNVQGTLNVLQAAAGHGVRRVVFASCGSIYGPATDRAVSEDDAPQPASLFAASKLAGEIYCRTFSRGHGLDTVALRYFGVYGPRQPAHGGPVPAILKSLRRAVRPALGAGADVPGDLLHVDDAVAATVAAAEVGAAGPILNIASGQSASALEILDILTRLLRPDPPPRGRPGEPTRPRVDATRARHLLGWLPMVSLVDGLARLVESADDRRGAEHSELAQVVSGEERPDV
jgi:UDP-glucose 4-epimerase